MEAKKVKGSDGFGNEREYEFRILTALEGLEILHTYGSLCTAAIPQILELVNRWSQSETEENEGRLLSLAAEDFAAAEGPVLDLIQMLPAIISTPRLLELCRAFLAGCKVDGQECDADGMCDLFRGRPHEVYAAVIHAVIANYPDYLPFLDSPDDTTGTKSGE